MKQKITAILITLCMVFAIMPITALAAPITLDVSEGNIVISEENANGYIITGSTTQYNVTVTAEKANITLSNLSIEHNWNTRTYAFSIAKGSTVELTISGTNTLTSGTQYAGLWVPVGAAVTIQSATGYSTDSLVAKGGSEAAGIGGSYYGRVNSAGADCGEITINSGKVEAIGALQGAGIGGGRGGNGGIVEISAGSDNYTVVTAAGAIGGAGIGGGAGYDVTDENSNVTRYGSGSGKTIIKGGTVTATGYLNGAGIGAGGDGTGGDGVDVTIDGGIVTANGGSGNSPGIGGDSVDVTISGGTVIATGHGGAGATQGTLSLNYTEGYKWRTSDTVSFTYSNTQVYTSSDANKYLEVTGRFTITDITLSDSTVALNVGNTKQLTATIDPVDAKDKTITWSSSDTDVATVDENGVVTGLAAGTATITATTANNKTASCEITVTEIAITAFALDKTALELNVNDSDTLAATITPDNATNKTITWSSSDTSVATVDENGVVVAIGAGVATITATTANGNTATCDVTVTEIVPEESGGILGFLRMVKMILELIIYIMGVFA